VYFAKNAGQVVSKESLLQTIWGDRFVTDEVITTCIFELRKALGDDARNPRFIQTIPKRGYRLIAPVVFAKEQTTLAVSSRWWKPAAAGVTTMLFLALIV